MMNTETRNTTQAIQVFKAIIRNLILIIITLFLSYFTAVFFEKIYFDLFPSLGSLFIIYEELAKFIIGMILSYLFFLPFLFTAFGGKYKYWWIGILLVPAVVIEIKGDLPHIYFPIALGFLGWLIGWGVHKLIGLLKKSSQPKDPHS